MGVCLIVLMYIACLARRGAGQGGGDGGAFSPPYFHLLKPRCVVWSGGSYSPKNTVYRNSLEIPMQRSFYFWSVGNNDHEGFEKIYLLMWTWEQHLTALELANLSAPVHKGRTNPRLHQVHGFILIASSFSTFYLMATFFFPLRSLLIQGPAGSPLLLVFCCEFPIPAEGEMCGVPVHTRHWALCAGFHRPPSLRGCPEHHLWDPCGNGWSVGTLGAHLMTVKIFAEFGNLSNLITLAVNLKMKNDF